MDTKKCSKCGETKPLTEYNKSKVHKDGYHGLCKRCRLDYKNKWRADYKEKYGEPEGRRYQQANGEKYAKWNAKRVKENAEWVDGVKEASPCMDCHNFFPAVCMDFDHIKGVKLKGVCWLVQNGYSREKIQEEIDKCEIVCSNCHRIRTHKSGRERPWYDKRRKYDRSDWVD